MRAVLAVMTAIISAYVSAADLSVFVPPVHDDPYTYAVCPSAAMLDDGRVLLAVSVGRWIVGSDDGWGEELRIYEYRDDVINVYIVDSSSWDGRDGLFEVCHNSLLVVGGGVLVASTTTWIPPGSTPPNRVPAITIYDDLVPWVWQRWIGFITHSWPRHEGGWEARWLGDPVLLSGPGGTLWVYWLERMRDDGLSGIGWDTTLSVVGGLPGNPRSDMVHIAAPVVDLQFMVRLETAAWNDHSMSSMVGLWSRNPSGDQPPWLWFYTVDGYPGLLWTTSGATVGPSGTWGRNPTLLRGDGGILIRPAVVFYETTPDGAEPPEYQPGDPVEFGIRVWWGGEPPPGLPPTLTDNNAAVGRVWSRRGDIVLRREGGMVSR